MSKSNKDESHIPPDASAIVEYFLNTTEQHTKHGFLDVLMTVDWRCQRLRQLIKYILNIPNIATMMELQGCH